MKKMMLLTMALGAMFASAIAFANGESELLYRDNDDGTLTVTGAVTVASGNLVIPESHNGSNVTAIADGAFANRADILDATLPSTLGEIAMYSFLYCANLTNVEIQAGVTNIGYGAFYGCSHLRHVTLPSTLASIDGQAFSQCGDLDEIEFPDSLVSIGYWVFSQTGIKSVRLPASVEMLGSQAFFDSGLTNADLSASSIKVINSGTFQQCRNLETVTLPTEVAEIGSAAFQFTVLKSIEIPAACTNIGNFAFGGSDGLTTSEFSDIYFLGDAPKIAPISIPTGTVIHVQPGANGFDKPEWKGFVFDPPLESEVFEVKIVAFSAADGKLHFTIALTDNKGESLECDGRSVALLGAADLWEDFEQCGESSYQLKGSSFDVEIPKDERFFKVLLLDEQKR